VACCYFLNLLDTLPSDESSSLREGLEATFQGKSHPFEQTSTDYIGERVAVQNSMKIRREGQSASNLSQTSEEDFGVGH